VGERITIGVSDGNGDIVYVGDVCNGDVVKVGVACNVDGVSVSVIGKVATIDVEVTRRDLNEK